MAYIYRYQLKDKNFRKNTDLGYYKNYIKEQITQFFSNNLKDIRVSKDFFEFKLYESVKKVDLQLMGRKLKDISNINKIYKKGFIRMKQELYALVYPNEDNKQLTYAEFIDALDIDNIEEFSERAKEYTINYIKGKENIVSERIIQDSKLQNIFYLDILTSLIDKDKTFLNENITDICCFKISGYHRVIDEGDLNYKDKHELSNYLRFEEHDKNHNNWLKVVEYEKVKEDILEKIKSNINFHIKESETVDALSEIQSKDKILFTVHNVGQGLATSLSKDGEKFLYFDFGMSEGENHYTKPLNITANINKNSTIIFSHIHRDHWYRISVEPNAFVCNWYIPDQNKNISFTNKCANVIIEGGSVQILKKEVPFNGGILFCGNSSKYEPTREAKHKHETGIGLRLECQDKESKDLNILIVGDQRYDYIDNRYLNNINILVASHHGGEYSRSRRKSVKDDIPISKNEDESIIIYSYGLGDKGEPNTHSHPSKTREYESQGWKNSYHTASSGDYEIELMIK